MIDVLVGEPGTKGFKEPAIYKLAGVERTPSWSMNIDPLKRKRQKAYKSLGPENMRSAKTSRPMPETIRISLAG